MGEQTEQYWETRFREGGLIWGVEPSPAAGWAGEWFKQEGSSRILVPGAGYGRNSKALSGHFRVEALELSEEAVKLGQVWDTQTVFRQGSILDPSAVSGPYDGIFAYDVLHLFLEQEREQLMSNFARWLKPGGLLCLTCFSDGDSHCGQGRQLEEGTYEYMPGKHAHFFTEADLLRHVDDFQVAEMGIMDEQLRYEDGSVKRYRLRYAAVRRKGD